MEPKANMKLNYGSIMQILNSCYQKIPGEVWLKQTKHESPFYEEIWRKGTDQLRETGTRRGNSRKWQFGFCRRFFRMFF